ncbi:Hypothetical predicted protein [Octopus vulgaris]|uniref:Uncharacterized protein n=2 Tax=Octopus vulgaris TaxID=6645 RepID=A0AA36FDN1_OCTVU|nr:Hypothetical predicted protein [Octopus vulgaris]
MRHFGAANLALLAYSTLDFFHYRVDPGQNEGCITLEYANFYRVAIMSLHSPECGESSSNVHSSDPLYSDSFESLSSSNEENDNINNDSFKENPITDSNNSSSIGADGITVHRSASVTTDNSDVSDISYSNTFVSSSDADETDQNNLCKSSVNSLNSSSDVIYSDTFEASGTSLVHTANDGTLTSESHEESFCYESSKEDSYDGLQKDLYSRSQRSVATTNDTIVDELTGDEVSSKITDFDKEKENYIRHILKRFQNGKKIGSADGKTFSNINKECMMPEQNANDFCKKMLEKVKESHQRKVEEKPRNTTTKHSYQTPLDIDPSFISRIKLKNLLENMKQASNERIHLPSICEKCSKEMSQIEASTAQEQFLKWRINELQKKKLEEEIENHLLNVACIHL